MAEIILPRRRPRPNPLIRRARASVNASVADGKTIFQECLRDPTLFLWALYILLIPVYPFSNGLPQPGDVLVLILAPVALRRWNGRMPLEHRRVVRPLLWFTFYVIIVNLFWTVALGAYSFALKSGFGLSPLFYIYNALVFIVALVMAQRHGERFIRHTVYLVAVSAILQTLISFVKAGHSSRGTVLFNNPNQLGYYAALSAVVILLGQSRAKLSSLVSTAGLLSCMYLALYSASKAALACIALMIAIGMLDRLRTILIVGGISAVLMLTANPISALFDKASERVNREEKLGFIEGRGYDRIINNPENLLFGAGEGDYKRYTTAAQGTHEIHSSVGTLVYCYGFIGTMLFSTFIVRLFRRAPYRRMLLLLPAFAYGLSHQGLRFTLVWVLFVLYVALKTPTATTGPPRPQAARP